MDWVTLETFWSVEEAQLALGFLQAEEIPCRLEGVAMAGNFWHLSNATGGVKLLVARDDAERAAALLNAVEHHREGAASSDAESDTESDAEPVAGETNSADGEDDVERDPVPAGDDVDDDADHPGLFDRLRNQKMLIILVLVLPMLVGIFLGVIGLLMTLVSTVANIR